MAGEIYLSNLSGQFDYQQILQKYQQLKFQQVDLIQQKENIVQKKKDAFENFTTLLEDFKKKFESLTDPTLFDKKNVTVSDESIASVTLTDPTKMNETDLSFTVTQLAKNDVWLSQSGVANRTDAVTSTDGTLTITYKGVDYNVNYTSTDTIDDIASKINGSGAEINASVFFDGTNYRLIVSGKDTGDSSTISFSDTALLLDDLQLGNTYSSSHVQSAQNAIINIYGQDVTSQTNTFSNVIDGLDITVKKTSSDSVTVNISNDDEAVKQSIEVLFDAYNSIVDFIKDATSQDGDLSGETSLHSVKSAILSRLTPLMEKNLISIDHTNGHISLKEDIFNDLIQNDRDGLKNSIDSVKNSLQPYLDVLFDTNGLLKQREKTFDKQIQQYEDRIEFMVKRIDKESENLKKQFIHLDALLAKFNDMKTRLAAILPKQSTK